VDELVLELPLPRSAKYSAAAIAAAATSASTVMIGHRFRPRAARRF
jgi:hypothetical protein